MPSSLPDPVLALSLTNVQKLNNVDVDQLANLWNVFTKCKESLESGRRLENLSWRLWFREAHLLPPEVSLSEMTDYTPLDTPLMSRRGSINGSYTTTSRAMPHTISQPTLPIFSNSISHRVTEAAEPLSDPEDGDWSSDDDEDESKARSLEQADRASKSSIDDRGRMPSRQDSTSQDYDPTAVTSQLRKRAEKKAVQLPEPTSKAHHTPSSSTLAAPVLDQRAIETNTNQQMGTSTPINGDRKRAVSSSSTFGSRARVKQHNTARRRRPLSFQQAIESLLLDRSKDFGANDAVPMPAIAGNASTHLSTSLQNSKKVDVGVDTNRNEGEGWHGTPHGAEMIGLVRQSSAPAEFSQPNTPSVTVASPTVVNDSYRAEKSANRETESPAVVTRLDTSAKSDATSSKKGTQVDSQTDAKAEEKKSKFFMAGQSVEDGDDDGWSSASSTDSAEMKKKQVALKKKTMVVSDREKEIEKKYKEKEKAKGQSLFQKVPIKSASTVDVRATGGRRRSSAPMQGIDKEENTVEEVQPIRGLLSSLFHPEEGPHPPPGQLAGRPHASAADLRQRPQRLSSSRSKMKESEGVEDSPSRLTRVPSTTQVPSIGTGALKLSKSAVALPVLSTMGSRSAVKGTTMSSRDAAVFDDDDEDGGEEHDSGETEGTEEVEESEALARLNRLAFRKKERQRQGKKLSATRGDRVKRQSTHSLNVEVSPEVRDEEMMRERRETSGSGKRASLPMPLSTSQRSSSSHIPDTSMPQTPRTTRRNMIREELSESLRQNLLWERQSRQRMLGIGAINNNTSVNRNTAVTPSHPSTTTSASEFRPRNQMGPPPAPPPAPLVNRNHSVLGGGQLRPLTSSNSVLDISQQQHDHQSDNQAHHHHHTSNAPHRTYTGDFHHAGW